MDERANPRPGDTRQKPKAPDADRALELKVEKMARQQARVGQTVRGGQG